MLLENCDEGEELDATVALTLPPDSTGADHNRLTPLPACSVGTTNEPSGFENIGKDEELAFHEGIAT